MSLSAVRSLQRWGTASLRHGALPAIGLVAVALRLAAVLRGGGLYGLGNYDDGVYYAAGTALLHGHLPYRDYVFLHPPGIVILLSPFGVFGLLGHDPTGLAAARLSWMVLGGLNTVLVAQILRPLGMFTSALGAMVYATAYPAIYIEWTPLLEGPAQTCVLAAVLILGRTDPVTLGRRATPRWVLAGALLGYATTIKIWGVVPMATVIIWSIGTRDRRRVAAVAAGAAAAITVVCLPFFVAAPGSMWRMVVLDQVGRPRAAVPLTARLADIVGLGLHHPRMDTITPMLGVTLVVVVGLSVLSATLPEARLSLLLAATSSLLLLLSPSWFLHYPGVATGPLAVATAAGAGAAIRRATAWRVPAGRAVATVCVGLVAVSIISVAGLSLGRRFPGAPLAVAIPPQTRCVTSDDPSALVEMNVLSRNLHRGCRFVADLGGYSYELAAARGHWVPRNRDQAWQQSYLQYLRSGDASLAFRYADGGALSARTRATSGSWPVQSRMGRYVLRRPS